MSDLTLIAEDILNTMQAMDEACHAMKALGVMRPAAQTTDDESHPIIQTMREEMDAASLTCSALK